MNKLIIVGNLTRDPEFRGVGADDVSCCTFQVAVNRYVKGSDHPHADYFRVTAWRNLAENCAAYLAKGRKVLVEGRVRASTYVDTHGEARASLEVNAENVLFLSPKGAASVEMNADGTAEPESNGFVDVNAEDAPF